MIYINNLEKASKLFDALSSRTRIKIIELLQINDSLNMDSLAKALEISNGALTSHIKKLADCGIIEVKLVSMGHGTHKICSLNESKLVIDLLDKALFKNHVTLELNAGQYSDCEISPTCGLCDKYNPLFEFDEPRYFSFPERYNAELLWFCDGFVNYTLPNPLAQDMELNEVQLSFEISSEGPFGAKNFPAEINIFNHNHLLCMYISPGEFTKQPGKFTPSWWTYGQYGELLTIAINENGTFLNGLSVSEYNISDLMADASENAFIDLKIACKKTQEYPGGITLFGKSFGNYPQGIVAKFFY